MSMDPQQWLARLAGEWTYEMEAEATPGEEPIRDSGPERVRALGSWMLCEAEGRTPEGVTATSLMTLGWDPERQRVVGTFISSMMTYLWLYDGQFDADGRVLTLEAEGPSYEVEGTTAKYRDTIEFTGDDHRVQTSSYLRPDGTWHSFMTMNFRRTQ